MRPKIEPEGQNERTFIDRARRAQIIACAVEVIAERGYARASLAEIARRAGVSKGVISYHFAGKDELIEQIVADTVTDGQTFASESLNAQGSAWQTLACYIEGSIGWIKANPGHIKALIEIFLNHRDKEGKPAFEDAGNEAIVRDLARLLRRGQESGELRPFDPWIVALTVQGAIDHVPMHLSTYPETDIEAYRRELVSLFERALRDPAAAGAALDAPENRASNEEEPT